MVRPLPQYHTAEMVRALPDDGNRYEVVWGELLVTPAPVPRHQRVVVRLLRALLPYCDTAGTVEPMISPADISWSDDTLVQPDLFVVPLEEARSTHWRGVSSLLLAVEVLSPGTQRQDRFTKRRLYQEVGVPDVWLVDVERRHVECWTPTDRFPRVVTSTLRWRAPGASADCVLDVAALTDPA
jgi:Uma2 family endonuclease